MRYPLGPFHPDKLPGPGILTRCVNAIPAEDGYRPVGGFLPISDALPAAFRGGASVKGNDGAAFLLAGTETTLSKLAAGSWTSLLSGLTVSGRWKFTAFGDFAVAVNGADTYEVDLVASSASAISGAPSFIDVCVVGDHVVGAQPDGNILRVRWSAFNDHTGWTVGTNQSGEWTALEGGEVMGVAGGEYGVILQRHRLTRMDLTGDASAPFAFNPFGHNFGCASKASIIPLDDTVFYLSDRGFAVAESGQNVRPIGNEQFSRSFRDALGEDDFERIWASVDPKNTCVVWGIPGNVGQAWRYDWSLDRATVLEFPFEGIFEGFENSQTLEEVAATYTNIDTMPLSLDDPRFNGGAPRLYFVQDGKVGTLAGANLVANFVSGNVRAGQNNYRMWAVWPETDAISGVTVKVTEKQRLGDGGNVRTGSNMQASGRIPLRANGKQFVFDITVDGPDWTYFNAVELEGGPGGKR